MWGMGLVWGAMELFGMVWAVEGWNLMACSGRGVGWYEMVWDSTRWYGVVWDAMECLGMLWDGI